MECAIEWKEPPGKRKDAHRPVIRSEGRREKGVLEAPWFNEMVIVVTGEEGEE